MEHIFKPGDRAYWVEERKWITLKENNDATYPIKCSTGTFTLDGRYVDKSAIALLPLNPYDPTDPNNPPEFRYPFMLNGRPVKIGDEVIYKRNGEPVDGQVYGLGISEGRPWAVIHYNSCSSATLGFDSGHLCWPDEVPKKKTTYLWAIPMYEAGLKENMSIGFKRMTKEEAEKYWKAEIVPGSEEESE